MSTTTCDLGDTAVIDLFTGINKTRVRIAAVVGAVTLSLNSVTGFNDGDKLLINAPGLGPDEEPERVTIAVGGINTATNTVTFTPALIRSHAAGQEVMEARNPTTVALTGDDPDGVDITKTFTDFANRDTGWNTYEHPMSKRGTWHFDIQTTGARPIAGTGRFEVEVS